MSFKILYDQPLKGHVINRRSYIIELTIGRNI